MLFKIDVVKNFPNFMGKNLCRSLFFNNIVVLQVCNRIKKWLNHRFFPMKFANLRKPFFKDTSCGYFFAHWIPHPKQRFDKNDRTFSKVISRNVHWLENCKNLPLQRTKITCISCILNKALATQLKGYLLLYKSIALFTLWWLQWQW